jgi:hypothetical protein
MWKGEWSSEGDAHVACLSSIGSDAMDRERVT